VSAIAGDAAVTAIGHAGVGIGLATIRGAAIAILIRLNTGRHRASAVHASAIGVSWGALGAASVAVVDVAIQVYFAPVVRVAIAIGKAVVAGAHATHANVAHGLGVRNHTVFTTTAAVLRIVVRIGLAPFDRLVAVPIGGLTIRDVADAVSAHSGSVRLVQTNMAARAAVVHAVVDIDLTPVDRVTVAVLEPVVAGNAAGATAATGFAVGGIAVVTTDATVLHVYDGV
jgi:hypothetical protein